MEAMTLLVIGLSGSGKTTLLHSLTNDHTQILPTASFSIFYVPSSLKTILAYDCSGSGPTRQNWSLFAQMCDSVLYVLDATDDNNFSLARRHLVIFLERHKVMKGKKLCICLNKCDVKERKPKEVYESALECDKLQKYVDKLYVKETSGYTKDGLDQCINWLIK